MHRQPAAASVPFDSTCGRSQTADEFSPSFPSGGAWSRGSAAGPPQESTMCSPLPTPKRKLSLDDAQDESTQSTMSVTSLDSAFADATCSASPDKENVLSPEIGGLLPANKSSNRRPFGSLNFETACSPGTRRQLYARRPMAQKKLSLSLHHDRRPSQPPRPLSLPVDFKTSPFLGQIYSPMERMSLSPCASCSSSSVASVQSSGSSSDGYFSEEVFDNIEEAEVNQTIPKSISDLINAPLAKGFMATLADSSSIMQHHHHATSPPEVDLITRPRRGSIKRSIEPNEEKMCKRQMSSFHSFDPHSPPSPTKKDVAPTLLQPVSESATTIFPTSPGENGIEMIGDHTKPYVLPLVQGSQPDQKSISPDTMVRLIEGEYDDLVENFTIIDCRFPFEYDGGHIKTALNIWDKGTLLDQYFDSPMHPMEESKHHIIIFHCEFSSKRGPNMSRFMRRTDRERNGMAFPKLFYPELYLLEGGYRAFFSQYPGLCDPSAYLPMTDYRYQDQMKHFTRRSKSWSEGGTGYRGLLRPRLATVGATAHISKLVTAHFAEENEEP